MPIEKVGMLILVMLFVAIVFAFLASGLETGEENLINVFSQGMEAFE